MDPIPVPNFPILEAHNLSCEADVAANHAGQVMRGSPLNPKQDASSNLNALETEFVDKMGKHQRARMSSLQVDLPILVYSVIYDSG